MPDPVAYLMVAVDDTITTRLNAPTRSDIYTDLELEQFRYNSFPQYLVPAQIVPLTPVVSGGSVGYGF